MKYHDILIASTEVEEPTTIHQPDDEETFDNYEECFSEEDYNYETRSEAQEREIREMFEAEDFWEKLKADNANFFRNHRPRVPVPTEQEMAEAYAEFCKLLQEDRMKIEAEEREKELQVMEWIAKEGKVLLGTRQEQYQQMLAEKEEIRKKELEAYRLKKAAEKPQSPKLTKWQPPVKGYSGKKEKPNQIRAQNQGKNKVVTEAEKLGRRATRNKRDVLPIIPSEIPTLVAHEIEVESESENEVEIEVEETFIIPQLEMNAKAQFLPEAKPKVEAPKEEVKEDTQGWTPVVHKKREVPPSPTPSLHSFHTFNINEPIQRQVSHASVHSEHSHHSHHSGHSRQSAAPQGPRQKTAICNSVLDGIPCRHNVCMFAHNIQEIVKLPCRYGERCRNVKKAGNVYVNTGTFVCKFWHTNETDVSYVKRHNLPSRVLMVSPINPQGGKPMGPPRPQEKKTFAPVTKSPWVAKVWAQKA